VNRFRGFLARNLTPALAAATLRPYGADPTHPAF
jgi:hypothetical protein